jgi:hypothetical protein
MSAFDSGSASTFATSWRHAPLRQARSGAATKIALCLARLVASGVNEMPAASRRMTGRTLGAGR